MIEGFIQADEMKKIWVIIRDENTQIRNYLITRNENFHFGSFGKVWLEQIFNRFSLHNLDNKKDSFIKAEDIATEPIKHLDVSLDIIKDSKTIESLLQFIFHPDYDPSGGLRVGFKSEEEHTLFVENLRNALNLIKQTDTDAYLMIKQNLKAICPIFSVNPLKKGDVISLSLDYCNGVVFYSPCPSILAAETLIHETRHNVLNLTLKKVNYLKSHEFKIKTPLREDLRPMLGLIHQAYVLCGLTTFYKKLLEKEPYNQMINVQKRYNIHLNDYVDAVNIIQNNFVNLTTEGEKLLNELINDIKKYG
jgi:hypothetical protein